MSLHVAQATPFQMLEKRARKERALRLTMNAVPDSGIDLKRETRDVAPLPEENEKYGVKYPEQEVTLPVAAEPPVPLPLTEPDQTPASSPLVNDAASIQIITIQSAVARYYNVTRADLMGHSRIAKFVKPRQIAMYLAKTLNPLSPLRSLPEIGRRFGGRDHTTALHAIRKITRLHATDEAVQKDIEIILGQLGVAS